MRAINHIFLSKLFSPHMHQYLFFYTYILETTCLLKLKCTSQIHWFPHDMISYVTLVTCAHKYSLLGDTCTHKTPLTSFCSYLPSLMDWLGFQPMHGQGWCKDIDDQSGTLR